MNSDPLEGRERARQEFEKLVTEAGFSAVKRDDGRYRATSVETILMPMLDAAYDLGRRSLEQERDELRTALQHAHLYFLQSNKLTVDDREMLDEMWAALHKGDS